MRTVNNIGIVTERESGLNYETMIVSCNRNREEKSCFYEFGAEKKASFGKFLENGSSKFISSLGFDSEN